MQNNFMDVWTRIDIELNRRNKGWQWLSDQLGFKIQRVHNWKDRGVPASQYRAIAEKLLKTVDWVEGLEPSHTAEEPRAAYNITPAPVRGKVPVVSWVQAGDWCDAVDPHPVGAGDEWLECPMKHSKSTFALVVRGSSMHNPTGDRSFSEGDIIFIDPERQAQHRSLVICRLDGSHEATFKRLLIEGDTKMLEAINPSWPDRIVKINGNATICGVVIGKVESY